jgi:hypothetical protein
MKAFGPKLPRREKNPVNPGNPVKIKKVRSNPFWLYSAGDGPRFVHIFGPAAAGRPPARL